MWIDVLATPGELTGEDLPGNVAVVVDAIRATTSLLAGLEAGASRALAVRSIEEALELRRSIGADKAVLCGEREGRTIDGFDLGNSPLEFRPENVANRVLVCTTTNGTLALEKCRQADELMLGCFRNRKAIADRVAGLAGRGNGNEARGRAVIVCAGKEGRLSLDDLLCAGLLVKAVRTAAPGVRFSDGARAALALANEIGSPTADFLSTTAAGAALVEIGLGADLEFCAELDVSRSVPSLRRDGFALTDGRDG
jgi:2-phosphosulfolactate phosphatase